MKERNSGFSSRDSVVSGFRGVICCLLVTGGMVLSGCRTVRPVGDALYVQQMERGAKSYAAGTLESAQDHFTKAFRRALAVDDVQAAATAAHNSAMVCAQLGDYTNALLYVDAGLEALERGRQAGPWDMLLLKSKIEVQRGEFTQAESTARQALAAVNTKDSDAEAEVKLFLARINLYLSDTSQSRQILGALLDRKLPEQLQAGCFVLKAELDSRDWQFDAAALSYDKAAALQQTTGLYNAMADSLYAAAGAWQRAGYPEKAGTGFLQAASTYYGQGRWVQALTAVRQALSFAKESSDETLEEQALVLFELIKQKVNMLNREELL